MTEDAATFGKQPGDTADASDQNCTEEKIMAMRNFKQLQKDINTNAELAKKIEAASIEAHESGDINIFIKAAAELGYEVTEQDIFGKDELVKLDEDELDSVAGGIFGCGDKAPDGKEIGCFTGKSYYRTADHYCPQNPGVGHDLYYLEDDPTDDDYEIHKCRLCGKEVFNYIGE